MGAKVELRSTCGRQWNSTDHSAPTLRDSYFRFSWLSRLCILLLGLMHDSTLELVLEKIFCHAASSQPRSRLLRRMLQAFRCTISLRKKWRDTAVSKKTAQKKTINTGHGTNLFKSTQKPRERTQTFYPTSQSLLTTFTNGIARVGQESTRPLTVCNDNDSDPVRCRSEEVPINSLFAYDFITVSSAWELTSVSMRYSQGEGVNTSLSRLMYCTHN